MAKTPVFDRVFSHKMKETILGVVEIKEVDPLVFQELLRFVYTNDFDAKNKLTEELLIIADRYKIDDLKRKCENILLKKLTIENVTRIIMLVDNYFANSLKMASIHFFIVYTRCSDEDFILIFKENYLITLVKSQLYLFLDIL